MRIVSLNRVRKSRRSIDYTDWRKKTPRPDGVATVSPSEQLRTIRRRAAGTAEPSSADLPPRMENIARIGRAIAEGRYHVSAADLAKKLIHHMLANRPSKL
jgi:anti-sigma28 factor (negative regulator of flagellin synthesis)